MKRWLSPHKAQRPCVGVVVRAAATGRIKGTRVPGALALPGREGQCRNHNFIIKIIFVITLYRPRTKPRPLSPIRGKPTLLLLVSPLSPIALQWVLSPRGKQISHGGAGPVQFSFFELLALSCKHRLYLIPFQGLSASVRLHLLPFGNSR